MSDVWPYLAAILPTILVAIFFYFLVKSMLEGDRRERIAQRKFEAEQDARRAASRGIAQPAPVERAEPLENGQNEHHRPPHDDLRDPSPRTPGN
jgi:hypothetical protein